MKVLLISHISDSKGSNGGAVYTRQIASHIDSCNPSHFEIMYVFNEIVPNRIIRLLFSLVMSLFASLPSRVRYFQSCKFRFLLKERIREVSPDIVVVDHLEMAGYRDILAKVPRVIYVAHNVESELHLQRVKSDIPKIFQPVMRRDIKLLRDFECEFIRSLKEVISISRKDEQVFKEISPKISSSVLYPAFDYERRQGERRGNRVRLGFVGNMGWWPNREGAIWLVNELSAVLPSDAELILIGRGTENLPVSGGNVCTLGFVNSIQDVWESADIFLNPIEYGSGTNIKLAEALYNRKPVVCSRFSADPLGLENGAGIRVLDSRVDWIEFCASGGYRKLASECPGADATRTFESDKSHELFRSFFLR